jgi:hypothetical protein
VLDWTPPILLSTFTRRQYEYDLEVLNRIAESEHDPGSEEGGAAFARVAGRPVARDLLPEFDVEYRGGARLYYRRRLPHGECPTVRTSC